MKLNVVKVTFGKITMQPVVQFVQIINRICIN